MQVVILPLSIEIFGFWKSRLPPSSHRHPSNLTHLIPNFGAEQAKAVVASLETIEHADQKLRT